MVFRGQGLHVEEGVQKREDIMPRGPFQKWEDWKVTLGIGGNKHIEMAAVETVVSGGVLADITVRL